MIRANIGDIGNFLNARGVADSPLRNITILADGDQIKLKGTLRKIISLDVPVWCSSKVMLQGRTYRIAVQAYDSTRSAWLKSVIYVANP